ncbi:MAG: RDD family protein [Pseudomonadota bacterium]
MSESNLHARAGFMRRLAAMLYDALVAIAVGMCAAFVIIIALTLLIETNVLSKQDYEHVSELLQASMLYKLSIQLWVAFWIMGFFLWFWKNGGQTIGMRAWRLRIFNLEDKETIGYPTLILRLFASLGGLGTLLVLFDIRHKQSLQDRLARTEVLVLSKLENDHKTW